MQPLHLPPFSFRCSRCPWTNLGLRAQLVLLVLLISLPLFAFGSVTLYRSVEERTQEELRNSRELAEATAAAFQNYLENLYDAEYALGTAIASDGRPFSAERTEELLRAQLPVHETVGGFSWLDPSGRVLASTIPGNRGKWLGDRSHIRRITNGEEQAVSDLIQGRLIGGTIVGVARGIRLSGRLVGIVVASIRPERLGMVLPIQRGDGSHIGLIDRNGVSVYHTANSDGPGMGQILPEQTPGREALRTGHSLVSSNYLVPFDSARRMGAFYLIPGVGWVAIVTSRLDTVFASAWSGARRELLGWAVLTLVSLLAAVVVGNSLLWPITALKQAALAISHGDLKARVNLVGENEVGTAARAFNQMADRIQELEADRNRFLQTAAHALRNPMTTVKGAVTLLRRRLAQGEVLGQDAADDLRIMEQEVDHLSQNLDEVLDAFCLHEGQLSVWREPVNLGEVARQVVGTYATLDKGHRYHYEETCSARVYGDSRRLEDVIRSLIANAGRFSPAGAAIKVRLEAQGQQALLSVKDEGIGIPSAELKSVFQPFFRGSNLDGRDPGGIGLGLYVSASIVADHGGRLWVESVEDQGSTFWLELPRLSAI